ncbi:MAG: hypothetical protein EB127_17620, partial [Alphaproteobacteria bacterium]|nr:hypothetical protein [Alphaproteobacteria bacterium]
QLLEEHGFILEETDWSKYDEPTINRIKKGTAEPVDRTDYNKPTFMRKAEGPAPKTGDEKRRAELKKMGALKEEDVEEENMDEALDLKTLRAAAAKSAPAKTPADNHMNPDKVLKKEPITRTQDGKLDLNALRDMFKKEEDIEESGLQAYLGNKKDGMNALRQAGREGAGKEEMAKLRAKYDKLDEVEMDEAKYHGKEVPLGKKLPGDVKKSKVYVRKPNGKVVKVNFGDKKMRIKKSNPKRRKSFRARHNCKNPGPRWKARYWSCRSW